MSLLTELQTDHLNNVFTPLEDRSISVKRVLRKALTSGQHPRFYDSIDAESVKKNTWNQRLTVRNQRRTNLKPETHRPKPETHKSEPETDELEAEDAQTRAEAALTKADEAQTGIGNV